MSKNTKKPDSLGGDRNKNNYQSQLVNTKPKKRIPPPASLSLGTRPESLSETPQTPSKQWTSVPPSASTANSRPDWAQVSSSQPYQPPGSRNRPVSNAEFPSLNSGNTPQKDSKPRYAERPPPKKPEEESRNHHRPSSPVYPPQRSGGNSYDSRHQQRQPAYHNQRMNQGNPRNNTGYGNRSGPQGRNRSNQPPAYSSVRSRQPYNRDESVPEMFAGAESSLTPMQVRSVPIKHAEFDLDNDAAGWAGKQNKVDYKAKIIFEDSGDEEERSLIPLTKISNPKNIHEPEVQFTSERLPNNASSEPTEISEKQRPQSPEPQLTSNHTLCSPLGPGKPFQIKKRPTSESIPDPPPDDTPSQPEIPTQPQSQPPPPPEEPPAQPARRPQQFSMRHEVPSYPKDAVSDSKVTEPARQPASAPRVREDPWKQDHHPPVPISSTSSQGDAHATPKEAPANVWDKRMNEKSEQPRQELPGFPKLGENGTVQSCVIIPSKLEKQDSGRGRSHRGQDDNVFEDHPPPERNYQERGYQERSYQGQWNRRPEDRRNSGRLSGRDSIKSEIDRSQNWRRESTDTGSRGGRGDRGRNDRDDRFEGDRFRNERNDKFRSDKYVDRPDRNSKYGRNDRYDNNNEGYARNDGRRDRGSANRGEKRDFQERDWGNRDRNSGGSWNRSSQNRRGPTDRGREDAGAYRDDDRNRKSSEGRFGGAASSSYAGAVSSRESEKEGTFEQEGDRRETDPSQSFPSGDYQGKGSDNWRRDRGDGPMRSSNQRRPYNSSRSSFSEQEGRARPSSRSNDPSARNADMEWPEDSAPRGAEAEGRDESENLADAGFTEIRNKNKSKGRGLSSGESDMTRPSMGRGRGRVYNDSHGQDGAVGSRWGNGKNSSGAEPRFSRGGSPQKSQGMGRARIPERQSQVSPKRFSNSDKRSTRSVGRSDSPPSTLQPLPKATVTSGGASSHYVKPGLSFSEIASKNIEKPQPPTKPATESSEENEASVPKEKVDQEVDTREGDEDPTATPRKSPTEMEEKSPALSEVHDEVQEVMTTTIVNSNMVDEVAEIDQTTHADLLAHTEPKEDTESPPEVVEGDVQDWSIPDEQPPLPLNPSESSRDSPPVERLPPSRKVEERVSITPTEIPQPSIPASISETKKSEPKPTPLNPSSSVFPDASQHSFLEGVHKPQWYSNPASIVSLEDVSPSLPFQYPPAQAPITDDDKAIRSKPSDLSEYINAPEFQPSFTGLPTYPDYTGSLANANFMSPPFPQDFSQAQLALSSLPPTIDTAGHSGLLAPPRIGTLSLPPGGYQPHVSLSSVYPGSTQVMPGTMGAMGAMGANPMRPPTQQFVRQVSAGGMPTSPSITPNYPGYGLPGNMRTAVMSVDNSRRNDKINMGDKGQNYQMFKKWDYNMPNQYNGQLRKTAAPFTPMMHQNVRNYTQGANRGGNYRPSKGRNHTNFIKYPQPMNIIHPNMHGYRPGPTQPFISVVGPVRPPPVQHNNQLRNNNYPYRGKNGSFNNYNGRQNFQQVPFYYPNRTSTSGPQITSVSGPSIESVPMPVINQPISFQNETDMNKNISLASKYNISMQNSLPGSQKFHSFSADANAEDNVASEYSKIGPVAVNGRNSSEFPGRNPEEGMSEKITQGIPENPMFGTDQVANILATESTIQQDASELKIKSHNELPSSSPPADPCQSAMDIYGPQPLVSSSSLVTSSEQLPVDEKIAPVAPLSTDKAHEEQIQPQVNLEP